MNQIHVINQVIEKSAEHKEPLSIGFMDYEKASDSLEIPAVTETLQNEGAQEADGNIRNIFNDSPATFVLHKKSRKLPIMEGVRQGGTISPMSFTSYVEVLRSLYSENLRVRVNGEHISNLRFGDDIVLFSNTGDGLQRMIQDANRDIVRVGLKVKLLKTKIISNSQPRERELRITSQALQSVREYDCLGQLPTQEPHPGNEMYRREKLGWSIYGRHSQLLTGSLPLSLNRNGRMQWF